jgi:uncharacterized membrane protein YphA (DoxX/SURF4 family)
VGKRIGFRWVVVFGVLLVHPFPLYLIPKTKWLVGIVTTPRDWAVSWFAQSILGLPDPPSASNGSGDRTFDYVELLLFAILAVLGAIAWSAADRRRTAYPRLAAGARVVLRYWVGSAMLSYGISKVLRSQFPEPYPGWLYQRLGDSSPMRLLWAFMGHSGPYTVFAGLAETIGGVLLLWRRTTTLGALLVVAVMTNVVLLNFSYDVCVKLYSTELLVAAGLIALPGARRLVSAAMGYAVPELPPRTRMSGRAERLRVAAKVALIATMVLRLYLTFSDRANDGPPRSELFGNWTVETFVADGVERPPLTTDPVRWEACTIHRSYLAIWLMNGRREGPPEPSFGHYPFEIDANTHTIKVTVDETTKTSETWTYARPAPDRVVLDGVHRGQKLHVTLRAMPAPLLVTRGFHWINEVPFNR